MRMTTYPIEYPDIWRHYKLQLASFWVAEEIDFSRDREHFNNKLNEEERHFVKNILVFFAASDTLVSLNLMTNFCKDVTVMEDSHVLHDSHILHVTVSIIAWKVYGYTFQAMMENVHAEVYSLMIETFIQDNSVKDSIYKDLGNMQSVIRKVDWAAKWCDPSEPFHKRIVAFAIVEGLFFSGAFCAIYWIKQRNLLPGLTKSNEFIARDEGLHTEFACLLHIKLLKRMSPEEAREMFMEAISIQKEFICKAVPCRLVGMNSKLMCQYIEHVADNLLVMLGYPIIFGSTNPFGFMELIGMNTRTNFFEERASLYQRSDVLNMDRRNTDTGDHQSSRDNGDTFFTEDF
eukprot:gene13291-biopygen22408